MLQPYYFGPGNWVGDVPATWVGIWFKNTSGQFNIENNVIGGGTTGSAGNEFLHTGASTGGYTIKGNRISGTYNAFLNLQNTSHDCEVLGNTYTSFSVTTWIQNPTLCKTGTITDNNDLTTTYGNIVSGGPAATLTGTGACATITTQSGGPQVGRATCTAATAASTLTITPGKTAPNGWVCTAYDETTRANLLQQTSTTTTACTLTATSVTQNDVFVFTASAF